MEFPRVIPTRKIGSEIFKTAGGDLGSSLLDFWRWSASDLLSNATRGRLAEFIVGTAVGAAVDQVRDEWSAYDLLTPGRVKIEVKSGAYIQSWHQTKPSTIIFQVPRTRGWNPETNVQDKEVRRQADVYVFALLAHTDQETVDPLDLDQWRFFVLSTTVLDERTRSQQSITLRTLRDLCGGSVSYSELARSVREVAGSGHTPGG
jgi:hypothetical protein